MNTYFAPAERLQVEELQRDIRFVSKNAIIDELMHSVSGFLAVLNEHRQILSINESLLEAIGVGNAEEVLGLRPGEALKCVYSCRMPGGCGTSEYCSTCGAALAIVSSLATRDPAERNCALTVERGGTRQDLFFRVRCVPLVYNTTSLLLLFLQDITHQQKLAALEKTFFHDVIGMINGLLNVSYLVSQRATDDTQELSQLVYRQSLRIAQEVAIQRCLWQTGASTYHPTVRFIPVREVVSEIMDVFRNHPVSAGRRLSFPEEIPHTGIKSDLSLLLRVLGNMIINACEATEAGGEVKLWVESSPESVSFCVWNNAAIPPDIARRVFQRNFSTKAEVGRGLGTYAMKLFGEEILGGTVDFTTSEMEGTIFTLSLRI
jgi:hypothetical protein